MEELISLLQTDTLGVLACPLMMSDFDEPVFDQNPSYDTAQSEAFGYAEQVRYTRMTLVPPDHR